MTPAQARAGLRWVLEVEHVGSSYYWTSDGSPVSSKWKGTLAVLGGLDAGSLREAISLDEGKDERRSVQLALQWPTDHAQEAVYGLDLTAATGTLRLLAGDQVLEDGRVIAIGTLSEPLYGGVGEPVRLTLGSEPWDDAGRVLDPVAVISPETWDAAASGLLGPWIGKHYPRVWGTPGVVDDGTLAKGSPAYPVDVIVGVPSVLVIADGPVEAATVQVVYEDGGVLQTAGSFTVEQDRDNLGRLVSVVDIGGLSSSDPARNAGDWWITWDDGVAMASPFNTGTMRTIGDVARALASLSSIPQDIACWAAVAQRFPWRSSGWVSEQAAPMDVLRDQVLPSLPVRLGWGRNGMRPIRIPYDAKPAEAIDHLVAGEDCTRTEAVVYDRAPRDLVQEIRVAYGPLDEPRYLLMAPRGAVYVDDTSSVWSRAAAQRWRALTTRSKDIVCPVTYSRSTAACVAGWAARIYGASPRRFTYATGAERAYLEPGDVVLLTDAELHEASTVCFVVARDIDITASVRLELVALPGWDSQARGAPAGGSTDTPWFPPAT